MSKSELAVTFSKFVAFAETQTRNRVNARCSDNESKCKFREMIKMCSVLGTAPKLRRLTRINSANSQK